MKLLYACMDLLFPPKCVLCGKLLEKEENDLCRHCREDTKLYPCGKRRLQFLDSFAAVWYYEKNPRKSILRYKFGGKRSYASAYGRILAMKLVQIYPEGFDYITWIPVSTLRRLNRGYDQGQLLAEAVAREMDCSSQSTLRKIRHNRRQSGITGDAQRKANVLGVYRVKDPGKICGKRILLLDDVLTTGATACECARMLRLAGAREVHCAVIAASRK